MKVRFFDPGKTFVRLKDKLLPSFENIRTKGDLILRKDVEDFEERLARYVGTKYAVGLNSGTDALFLSLKALGIGAGDEVIVPSHTFKATAGAVVSTGADPIIVDVDENGLIDVDKVKEALTSRTKAVIPVHITGLKANTERLNAELPSHVHIIEDACQAIGAIKPIGITQCWSFYPAKILGGFGDAGAITTDSEEVFNFVRGYRNHFKETNEGYGFNSRMDNVLAGELNIILDELPQRLLKRKIIAEKYNREFKGLKGIRTPIEQEGRVWQDYVLFVEDRVSLFQFLKENEIETMKDDYPFIDLLVKPPQAEKLGRQGLRLPCNQELTESEVEFIIKKIKEYASIDNR